MIPLVQPMAASVAPSLPVGPQWSYEVKWDGYRALLVKDGSRTRLVSRNLKDLTADYPHIANSGIVAAGFCVAGWRDRCTR